MDQVLLEVSSVSKSFGSNRVLHGASLTIAPGQVVSLVGENGAGKSTLAKIIAGIISPDSGSLTLAGRPLTSTSPRDALEAGIGIVHQELCLAGNLSIAQNLALGRETTRFGFLSAESAHSKARKALERLGVDLEPTRLVSTLSPAQKQMVEIARALAYDARIIIFDEPTSSISDTDAAHLLQLIKELRAQGVAILYVSHRLTEVLEISDRIVCLRDGNITGEVAAASATRAGLISLIVGRELKDLYGSREYTQSSTDALELRAWRATASHSPLHLTVKQGEIVGIAGLIGAGRTEVLESIFGIRAPAAGSLLLNGELTTITSPHAALRAGIALLPEDRKEQGAILNGSIVDNITLSASLRASPLSLRPLRKEAQDAELLAARCKVRYAHLSQPLRELSGGNQQKVVLARCLATAPAVLLLDEPTRGIDIGARREIYAELRSLAARGLAILFVSSDLEEIIGLADRVLVMSAGTMRGELLHSEVSEAAIISLASPESDATIAA
jgi:ribose transport system ATP-binding protein